MFQQLERLEEYNQHLRDELDKLSGEMKELRGSILSHVNTCHDNSQHVLIHELKKNNTYLASSESSSS